ncbi:hypothetical protein P3W45_001760 [Vairimorpha bombi]|jgi:hypothetical protein
MKDLCTHFQEGKCRYGTSCKKKHITVCPLLDPPIWIFTNIDNVHLKLHVVSSEEIRYSLRYNDTRRILDDMWMDNYTQMYKYMNDVCKKGSVMSTSKRCIDIRKNPDCFNLPFDLAYVEERILKLREEFPIIESNEMLVGENDGSTDDIDVENAPSFVKEYAYKKEAEEGSKYDRRREYNKNTRDWNNIRNTEDSFNNREYNSRDNINTRGHTYNSSSREYNRDNNKDYNRDNNRDNNKDYNRDNNKDYNRDNNRDNYNKDYNRDYNKSNTYRDNNKSNTYRDNNKSNTYRDNNREYNRDNKSNTYRDNNKNYNRDNKGNTYKNRDWNNKDTDRESYKGYSNRTHQDGRPFENRNSREDDRFGYKKDQSNFGKDSVNKKDNVSYKREDDGRDYDYKNIPYDHRQDQ